MYFLENIGRVEGVHLDTVAENYDRYYGQPDMKMKEKWQNAVKEIQRVESWDQYYERAGLPIPNEQGMIVLLKNAVISSRKKGYHGAVRFCNSFMNTGSCRYGVDCKYAHITQSERQVLEELSHSQELRMSGESNSHLRNSRERNDVRSSSELRSSRGRDLRNSPEDRVQRYDRNNNRVRREPRMEPRAEPRSEPRAEPRTEPRESRGDYRRERWRERKRSSSSSDRSSSRERNGTN